MIRNRRRETGSILVTSVVVLVILASLSAALVTSVLAQNTQAVTNERKLRASALAEGATEVVEKQLLQGISNFVPLPAVGTKATGTVPFTDPNNANRTVATVDYEVQQVPNSSRTVVDTTGLQTFFQEVSILADLDFRGAHEKVRRLVEVAQIPLFQFAVFYNRDLEILPGPNMTLTGRIHSNRDIYIGSDNTLTINSPYLRAAGNIYRKRKNDGSMSTGTVNVLVSGSTNYASMDSYAQQTAARIPTVSGLDSNFRGYDRNGDGDFIDSGELSPWVVEAIRRWNGTVQTAEHDIHELVPPEVKSIKRYEPTADGTGGDYNYNAQTGAYTQVSPGTGAYQKAFYHKRADLVILDGVAYNRNGSRLTLPSGTLTSHTMYDARERRNVTVTEVDMALLNTSGYFPANGLLYAARSDARLTQPNGIRLKNGSTLAAPLTVVSEDPVYVWGDYNTVAKKPAAVICDAVNLLSNRWDDSKRSGTLPTATPTTYNFAMITGNYDTTTGNYNGGFENFPRFHENWTNVACNIRGSFVNLYLSDIARGAWVYGGDHYTAPNRNWDYDPMFNNPNTLPPFTPRVAYVTSVAWYKTLSELDYREDLP
jgi:type II secretory pathway pseudopilin PulG